MKTVILLLFVINAKAMLSQDSLKTNLKYKKNNIHLSLAGENLVGASLNYERCFFNTKYIHLGAGIGVGINNIINLNYIFPIYVSSKFGNKKHFAIVSFGINNAINPRPFPKTKNERKDFEKNYSLHKDDNNLLPKDKYYPPYTNIPFVSLAYNYTSSNGFMIQPEICYIKYQQNTLINGIWHFFPKLKIGYAF